MNFDLNNTKMIEEMTRLGLAIPAEDIDDYELSEEEKVIAYRDKNIVTKEKLIDGIDDAILNMKEEPHDPHFGEVWGFDREKALRMFGKLRKLAEESPLSDTPDGMWSYEFSIYCSVFYINLIREDGYFLEDFCFFTTAMDEKITLFCGEDDDKDLHDSLYSFPENERKIIELRYGLTGEKPKTTEEIQKELGISSQEEVLDIEKKIMNCIS